MNKNFNMHATNRFSSVSTRTINIRRGFLFLRPYFYWIPMKNRTFERVLSLIFWWQFFFFKKEPNYIRIGKKGGNWSKMLCCFMIQIKKYWKDFFSQRLRKKGKSSFGNLLGGFYQVSSSISIREMDSPIIKEMDSPI